MDKTNLNDGQEEHLQSQVTPELLRFFDRSTAYKLVRYFAHSPSATTSDKGHAYDLSGLSKKAKQFLAREVTGRRIIELGNKGYKAGFNVPSYELLKLGARSYEGCDPKYNVDGLTFLLRQPDESAIVSSFGVLEDGVLFMGGCEIDPLLSRYVEQLSKQVHRVTPNGGITIHGLDHAGSLLDAGFEIIEPSAPSMESNCNRHITVLRKR